MPGSALVQQETGSRCRERAVPAHVHPHTCKNHSGKTEPGVHLWAAALRSGLVSVTSLGSRAAGTCASLTGEFGSTPPSFPSVCYLDGDGGGGDSRGRGGSRSHRYVRCADAHAEENKRQPV